MAPLDVPRDPGLQVERTLLAWRRTGLAVMVVSAVGIRLVTPLLGWIALILGCTGLLLALVVYVAMGRQLRRVHGLQRQVSTLNATGWPQLVLGFATSLLGLAALSYIALGL